MTQRQLTHQEYLSSLVFHSISSIGTWAGLQNSHAIKFLDNDLGLPYVEKSGLYYYFGNQKEWDASPEYRLVCTANKDLGAEQEV